MDILNLYRAFRAGVDRKRLRDDVAALTGAARKTVTVIISLLAAAAVAVTVSVAIIVRLRA